MSAIWCKRFRKLKICGMCCRNFCGTLLILLVTFVQLKHWNLTSGAWRSGHTLNLSPQFFLKPSVLQRISVLFKQRRVVRWTVAWKTLLVYLVHPKIELSGRCVHTLSLNFCCLISGSKEDHYEIKISHNRAADFAISTGPQSDYRVGQLYRHFVQTISYSLGHSQG